MRAGFLLVSLAACGFEPGLWPDGGGMGIDADGSACAWSYSPTNFDPCALPPPLELIVTTELAIDTAGTSLPKRMFEQSDGTSLTVIHLSTLTVEPFATLTLTGTAAVLAVDGEATINGTIVAAGGHDHDVHCAAARGADGTDSGDDDGGAGGGGGAAAADNGGMGTHGSGILAGFGGAGGVGTTSTLSPLRGGCRGGNGGRPDGDGQAALGGRGGGALQISTNTRIRITGFLDAAGRGGGGGPRAHYGAGGGGSGGSILLEGPTIEMAPIARICADGGSGGEGGGATVGGNDGLRSPCTALFGAETPRTPNLVGGRGGRGGFREETQGGVAGPASSSGGGGGGGGSVGWIRINSPDLTRNGAMITPDPL